LAFDVSDIKIAIKAKVPASDICSPAFTYRAPRRVELPTGILSGDCAGHIHSELNFVDVSRFEFNDVFMTATGAVITADGCVISETLEGNHVANEFAAVGETWSIDPAKIVDIEEPVVCTSRFGSFNYSVFLHEILPSFYLSRFDSSLSGLKRSIFFPRFMSGEKISKVLEFLRILDVHPETLLTTEKGKIYRLKTAHVLRVGPASELARIKLLMLPMMTELAMVLGASPGAREKIYIRREPGSIRHATNHEEITDFFASRGFRVLELAPMSLADQARLFGGAAMVVAEHGAALANLWYMPPGGAVLELFPQPLEGRSIYRVLAQLRGLRYRAASFPTSEGWVWNADPVTVPMNTIIDNLGEM
jgi:hypothetical protein